MWPRQSIDKLNSISSKGKAPVAKPQAAKGLQCLVEKTITVIPLEEEVSR
jgi:hypothetical protein